MNIKMKPMGEYQTNCYIVTVDNKDIIIDAGVDATHWVIENTNNPIAILNTHGHFDHIWSNAELKKYFNIPIYIPKEDAFMLSNDPFRQGIPKSTPDYLVDGDETINLDGIEIKFRHFAGHTRGSSVIEIDNIWFSGDFLFKRSIGRWDFPTSSGEQMIKSLKKAAQIEEDYIIYCGHGESTTLREEQKFMPIWAERVRVSL
ncbi:MAG: MBL fold metallo-hydrolase [Sulfurovum sp.]|nr:MBL fold metallo-hydrolase [Sulfurovaceae bacterium]